MEEMKEENNKKKQKLID